MEKYKVFLGGTIGEKDWRNNLIPFFEKYGIEYFNPVLPKDQKWTEADRENEENQKKICKILLYIITPEMKGVYSIAEAVQSSNIKDAITILCFLKKYNGKMFSDNLYENFKSVGKLIEKNDNTYIYFNLKDVIYKILEFY